MKINSLLKKNLLTIAMLFFVIGAVFSETLPYTFVNNSDYSDDEIYVAIVGISTNHVWIDAATGNVNTMSTSYNTISGPVYNGDYGPGGDGLYADCFTKLSDIPNKTVDIPQIAGCRIMMSFGSQLYLYFYGETGGYSAPNLSNPNDPNQGVKYELVELTYNDYGLWCNTTRVDNFQYPMGLEVNGTDFYKKVGELLSYDDILARWSANAPDDFQPLYDSENGIIHFPSKSDEFPTDYFDDYIDAIWSKYTSDVLSFYSGDAGTWNGTVSGDVFTFTRESDGQVAYVYSKPSQEEALEGSGAFASGGTYDLIVQAQLCAAINRHALDLTLGSGVLQDFSDEDSYYQTEPYNYYCKFFHNTAISYESNTYTFCYDDVFDHSSTIHTSDPEDVTITIGGFYGIDGTTEEFTPSTSKWYVLTNRKSGLNMRIADCNTASETNLELYDGTGTCAQWRFIENNGVWTIQNRESGLNIRHDGETVVSDETLAEMISTNGDRTYFKVYQSPKSGYYNIQHVGSGFNLRNNDCETENDATTIEFYDGDGECAQWQFVEAADITGEFSTKIEAEDFSSYSGVETEDCDEGGENVGYIETGDWMLYSDVELPYSGTYTFSYRVASESTGGQLSLDYSSGSVIVDYVDIPVTGAWQTWSTVTSSVTLDAGTYDFGIYAQEGGWNFNWFSIAYTGTKSTKEENNLIETESEIKAYPNPASDLITVTGITENAVINIYSITGVKIKSVVGSSINVSNLSNGTYILQVNDSENIKSIRFIKE